MSPILTLRTLLSAIHLLVSQCSRSLTISLDESKMLLLTALELRLRLAGVQLNELMDPESGFLGREGLILRVDILECCPWFEFADLETYASGTHSAAFRAAIHAISNASGWSSTFTR